jgi:hypothetical protein
MDAARKVADMRPIEPLTARVFAFAASTPRRNFRSMMGPVRPGLRREDSKVRKELMEFAKLSVDAIHCQRSG